MRRERVKLEEAIVSLAMVDQKGKAVEVPASKLHKKRKKSKTPVEEMPKKAKILAFALFTVWTAKVNLALCL